MHEYRRQMAYSEEPDPNTGSIPSPLRVSRWPKVGEEKTPAQLESSPPVESPTPTKVSLWEKIFKEKK